MQQPQSKEREMKTIPNSVSQLLGLGRSLRRVLSRARARFCRRKRNQPVLWLNSVEECEQRVLMTTLEAAAVEWGFPDSEPGNAAIGASVEFLSELFGYLQSVDDPKVRKGTVLSDTIKGSDKDEKIFGREGNDTLKGGGGADKLHGGPGSDTVKGGADRDELNGDEGSDSLFGGGQSDALFGGAGDDSLFGGTGMDWLVAGAGFDDLWGGKGADSLVTRDGINTAVGTNDHFLVGNVDFDTYIIEGQGTTTIRDLRDGQVVVHSGINYLDRTYTIDESTFIHEAAGGGSTIIPHYFDSPHGRLWHWSYDDTGEGESIPLRANHMESEVLIRQSQTGRFLEATPPTTPENGPRGFYLSAADVGVANQSMIDASNAEAELLAQLGFHLGLAANNVFPLTVAWLPPVIPEPIFLPSSPEFYTNTLDAVSDVGQLLSNWATPAVSPALVPGTELPIQPAPNAPTPLPTPGGPVAAPSPELLSELKSAADDYLKHHANATYSVWEDTSTAVVTFQQPYTPAI